MDPRPPLPASSLPPQGVYGFTAFAGMLAMSCLAASPVRRHQWEVFKTVHFALHAAVIVLVRTTLPAQPGGPHCSHKNRPPCWCCWRSPPWHVVPLLLFFVVLKSGLIGFCLPPCCCCAVFALPQCFLHATESMLRYVMPPLLLWAADRALRLWHSRAAYRDVTLQPLPGNAVRVTVKAAAFAAQCCEPGQWVYLSFSGANGVSGAEVSPVLRPAW